jgi:ion channel-forming bestrophin family protein
MSTSVASPTRPHRITANPPVPHGCETDSDEDTTSSEGQAPPTIRVGNPKKIARFFGDPVIPALNAYGTFDASASHSVRRMPSDSSQSSEHQSLAPAETQGRHPGHILMELIPFTGLWQAIFTGKDSNSTDGYLPVANGSRPKDPMGHGASSRKWSPPLQPRIGAARHHPIKELGENLPLEILRCLDEWFSVIEERGTANSKFLVN